MISKELLEFIDWEHKRLREFKTCCSHESRVKSRVIKLMEEVGEFSGEILGYFNDQRTDKLENYSLESLNNEFADIIITTLLIAKELGIPVKSALKYKIDKIKKRKY